MRNWTISQIFRAAGHLSLGAVAAAALTACEPAAEAPTIGADDIGGVVTGAGGPEAGVWVIAETADLPTRFARIVVTDDQGRYLIPDPARGELRRVGARLRPGRFGQASRLARHGSEPDRGAGARRTGSGGVLPGGLLAVAAPHAGRARVSGVR